MSHMSMSKETEPGYKPQEVKHVVTSLDLCVQKEALVELLKPLPAINIIKMLLCNFNEGIVKSFLIMCYSLHSSNLI